MTAANTGSQANGALMRISPLGIWGWRREPREVAEAARADARLTHPHEICQEASAVYAVTIARAIRDGGDPATVYEWALRWAQANVRDSASAVIECLERAATDPPAPHRSS